MTAGCQPPAPLHTSSFSHMQQEPLGEPTGAAGTPQSASLGLGPLRAVGPRHQSTFLVSFPQLWESFLQVQKPRKKLTKDVDAVPVTGLGPSGGVFAAV